MSFLEKEFYVLSSVFNTILLRKAMHILKFLLLENLSSLSNIQTEESKADSFEKPPHSKSKIEVQKLTNGIKQSNFLSQNPFNFKPTPNNPLLDYIYRENLKKSQKLYEKIEIGDVVYLKHPFYRRKKDFMNKPASKKSGKEKKQGLVIADSNSLFLALKDGMFHEKNAYKIFKKALFRIESDGISKPKIPIAYGDKINFRHLYSNRLISIKPKTFNKNGGLSFSLEEETTKYTHFQINPGDKSKDIGDAIAFYEKILIGNMKSTRFWGVSLSQHNERLEVSCLDNGMLFKLCRYMKGEEFERYESCKGEKLRNGDILMLRNRENKGLLTVGDWSLRKALFESKIKVYDSDEKFNATQIIFSLNQLNIEKLLDCYQEIEIFLQNNPSNFNHFWEIQYFKPFQSLIFKYSDRFRLRNLATGLYLAVNKTTGKLLLTYQLHETNENVTEFHFETLNLKETLGFHRNVKLKSEFQQRLLTMKGAKGDGRMNVAFEPKKSGETWRYSFEICPVSAGLDIEGVERITAVFNTFLSFHFFLQSFGMIEQENNEKNNNEFHLKYDYDEAMLQEMALEAEINRFESSCDSLIEFLRPSNLETYRERQLSLKELKIIELLILLAKIIDILIYSNKNSKERRQKASKNQDPAFPSPEKSPFFIAKKHLEIQAKVIYRLLCLAIKSNAVTSNLLLEHGDFLSSQLYVYPKEVSLLLRNALRSVPKELLEDNMQLLDWLSSLESLNELGNNIEEQTELIDILATALIDNKEKSVRINQQRIQLELFSHRGGSEMKRGLLRFAFLNEKPVIIFKKESDLKEFLTSNPSLSVLSLVKIKENEDFSAFYLEELIEKIDFTQHIRYISSVLTMIALLIKDRNMKVISKVSSLGISFNHILYCLKSPRFPLKLKAAYLLLYQNLYLDREPFVPISKYRNRCVLWSNIKDFSIINPTYHVLNLEDLQNPEVAGGKVVNQHFLDFEGILNEFWSEKGFIVSWMLSIDLMNPVMDRLEFIYVFLQVTRNIIDLGYTTNQFNQKVFIFIARIFETLLKEPPSNFWLGDVLKEAMGSDTEQIEEEKEDLIGKIFFEATKILKVYYQVLEIVQINVFMQMFKENFENFTTKPSFDYLFNLSQTKTQTNFIKTSQIPTKTGNSSRFESKILNYESQIQSKGGANTPKKTSEVSKTYELGISVWLFLLQKKRVPPKTLKGLMKVVLRYSFLRKRLFEELKLIELIDGKKEEELYKELDGTPILFGQVISPKKLEFQIERVLNEYDDRIKGNKDLSQRESKIRELNNVINKLLVKFKETLTLEKSLFIQMQNIIRNLQVHEYIFRLLSMQSSKKAQEEIELFHITIDFFQFFCQDNHINQMWVLSHIKPLLELLLNKICVNKLLRSALALKKSQHELISPYIDLLFTFLSQNYSRNKGKKSTQNPFKFLGYEILITIKAILYNAKTNTIYPENQKKVLNSLLKNDFMLKFSKSLYYIENKNKLIDKIKGLDSIKNMKCLPLLYHLILIELLGHLALDFKLGVLKLQKILVYEQLKALLYDPLTPFLVKKPYLRVLFSVYFIFLEEEYTSASMDDLKAFLTQILKDLNSSFSFLEYLIKPNKNGELTLEQKQARQEILTNKNYYMENLEEKERQQIQHNKKAMANTGMSTGINEQKKILFDGKEYWKYFHGGSRSFNGKKDGFVMILLDFLKEIEKRSNWNKDELMESFEKIRKALVKIKASFGKIEKVFSINLTKYHLIIHETLRKLPQKHLKKAQLDNLSKNLILEESKIEDLTNSDKICQVFLEKILEFAGKKSISLGEISGLYGFETIIVTKEEFIDKTREILKGFGDEFNLPKEEINIFVENFMLFKKNSRQEMNFKRFMNKLEKLMEKKRAIYQREGLKQEKQTMLKLEDQELSLQKKASLQNFIKWYQNDCIQKNKDSELNSLVKRFIEEIEREKSENHKLLMVRLLEIFNAYGDSSHLLRILELFTEEIVRKKEEEILRNCFWGTGVIKRLLMVLRNGEVLEFVDRALNILLECLIMEGKNVDEFSLFLKIQDEILKILFEVESRHLLVEFFSFLKMCLTHQQLKAINGETQGSEITFKMILFKAIKFLALLCENCYQPFQNFLREQEFANNNSGFASSNLIKMTANLLGILPINPLSYELIEEILKTLNKYCLGPCVANQIVLSSNKILFQFLNENVYRESYDFLSEDPNHLKKIRVLHISVKLLLSLADARKELDQFLTFLDLDQFLRNMLEIYTERISPNVKTILNGETIGFENPYHQKIIESGFDIFILLSILKDSQPNHPKLKLFTIDLIAKSIPKPKEKLIKFKSNQIIPLELMQVKNSNNKTTDSYKLIQQNLFENQQNIARDCSKTSISLEESSEEKKTDTSDVISKNELQMCLFFYKSLVGYVEIINNGVLRKVYFPKPFLCIYLTPNIKRSLLIEGRNDLLKRRLEHLLRNLERYKGEMLHFRMIGRLKVLNYLVKSWRLIKDLSFVLISFIILFLLIGENVSSQINQIVTIIQLILGVFVAIFCIVERYPLSMSLMPPFQREVSKYLKFREYVVKPRIKKTDFKFYICLKLHKFYQKIDNSRLKVLKIFLDFENLYNLVYLSITIVAFNNPYFYSIMLLDIIKRSKILQNIIKPVTENWIQLLKLGVLTMVIIFIFAVIAFSEYHEKFQENPNSFNMSSYGSTLWLAYMSTLNLGLRKEGGFGSVLIGYKIGDDNYWSFWIFSFWFYIIVNILLVKMVFWIIIDKFRVLRETKGKMENEIRMQCFICGIKKQEFELRGNGWHNHIFTEHNVYNYLNFAIYIEEKNKRDCNELEKYIKEMLLKKNTEFFPMNRAMVLEESIEKLKRK